MNSITHRVEQILSLSREEWNEMMIERNPKEEWLRFEPFKDSQARFVKQLESRLYYSDGLSNWRDLRDLTLEDIDLSLRDLSGVNLSGAKLKRISFLQSGLRGGDFSNCIFEDVDLSGALVYGARFVGSRFINTNFAKAIIYCTNFAGSIFVNSDWRAADLCQSSLESVQIKSVLGQI